MTQADDPSLSWLALPAVMLVPGPSTGCSERQALERRVGAIALVLGKRDFPLRDLAGFLVLDGHRHGRGDDFRVEAPFGLSGCSALLGLKRIFVLALAADLVALGDGLRGAEHGHVDVLVHGDQRWIAADPHFRSLDEADRILAARGDDIHPVDDDLLGGRGDRHQARGALAVDRLRADGDGAAGAKRDLPADIARLRALGQDGAPDDVVDLARLDPGAFDRRCERQGAKRRAGRGVEGALVGPSDRGSRGRNDYGVADGHQFLLKRTIGRAIRPSARAFPRPRFPR